MSARNSSSCGLEGTIAVFALAGDHYEQRDASVLLPELDLARVARLVRCSPRDAVRELRASLERRA